MKKIILVLMIAALGSISTMSASAFVDTRYMLTDQYLRNSGYSSEMSRMISTTTQDPYREPYVEKKSFKNLFKRAHGYIFPTTFTDMDFYNHSGNFNNPSWRDL